MSRLPASLRPWLESLLLFAAGIAVSLLYLQAPTLGDDIEYWGLALDLHQGLPGAWQSDSFHDLRWPVWGLCWLLQIFFGFTSWSYYLQPGVYLGAGAVLVFQLARRLNLSRLGCWASALVFLFHPLLDPSVSRPMPDLSEGFWVALSFFLWLLLMQSDSRARSIVLCALVGLSLTAAQANRITGVFAIPVLLAATLICFPRRFGWLVVCGLFTLLFVGIEASIYHHLTGDWLHSLHANLGAKGRKGTESIPIWEMPFRFMPLLWRMPPQIIFSALATGGLLYAWARHGKPGRALAVYAVIYYLTYNCAVQELFPPRPLVRDGERFLASLAFPLSILTVCGLSFAAALLHTWQPIRPILDFLKRRPAVSLAILLIALVAISPRSRDREIYLDEVRSYLASVPSDARVFSHDILRYVTFLADPAKASSIQWKLDNRLLEPNEDNLKALEDFDRIWLIRKHTWLRNRKLSETGRADQLASLAPYLTPPLAGWKVEKAIAKGDVPDFLFLTRDTAAPSMEGEQFARQAMAFSLPFTWEHPAKGMFEKDWQGLVVPPALRGKQIFLWIRYSSNRTEPLRLRMEYFDKDGRKLSSLLFKPYLFPETSPDFFAWEIPANAETMNLNIRVNGRTDWIRIEEWKVLSY